MDRSRKHIRNNGKVVVVTMTKVANGIEIGIAARN